MNFDTPKPNNANDIWQCEAHHVTFTQAAQRFAAAYWDKPRKIQNLKIADDNLTATFSVVDGIATYHIRFDGYLIVIARLEQTK